MKHSTKRILSNIFYPLLALGIVLALWAIVAAVEKKPLAFPSLNYIFPELFNKFGTIEFWEAIGNTLLTTLEVFLLAVAFALLLSIIGTLCPPIAKIMAPICTILRSVPTMAVILLSIFWMDQSYRPILVGFLIAFPLLYALFYQALNSVDKDLLDMAKVYKVSKIEQVNSIYIPSVIVSMLGAMQSSISLTCKVVIATEAMVTVQNTIGSNMMLDKYDYLIVSLLAWTVAAILLCFVLEGILALIKKIAEVKYGYKN